MLPVNLLLIIGLGILYGYMNGVHGSASVVATVISSRALRPRAALALAAVGIGAGPFLLGVAVANTLGAELLSPHVATVQVIVAALMGAIVWSVLTLRLKLPSSVSHALIGGLVGAGIAAAGPAGVQFGGLNKVLIALFLSPVLGLLAAYALVRLIYLLAANASPAINDWFRRVQIVLSLLVAVAFGANAGQKIVAVIVLGLVATGLMDSFTVPVWVVALSAVTTALGALVGGWGIIQTLSGSFYKIRPVHGFSAQMASGVIILGAGLFGGPVSGSQVVTSSILGSGSADRIHKVRWGVAQQILISWLLTIPLSGLMSFAVYTAFLS
ncbi:MAG TPA: inorganic phosphate transporter [Spirillospora sp.]|nr:inorganic phosphate transporter [Spirillospora sp.]